MARFLKGLVTKAATAPDAPRKRFSGGGPITMSWGVPYREGWTTEQAVTEGVRRSLWTYKAMDSIAKSVAGLPVDLRKGGPVINDLLDYQSAPSLWRRLNQKANPQEYAWTFRYRAMSQLLLSPKGIFMEYGQDDQGQIEWMYLLNPDMVAPIPHPTEFVSGFEITVNGQPEPVPITNNVLWIKLPHPTDPWRSLTPLESAGLSIDLDYYSRLYNRNFMANDGRPAGLLTVAGGLDDDDAEILKGRFSANSAEPGRITVIEADNASFQDLSTTPRDASYSTTRTEAMSDILGAFGVPRSQTGDATGVSQDQSEVEEFIYWRNTVLPYVEIFNLAYGSLTPGGEDDDIWVRHNTSEIKALQRPIREEDQRAIEQWRDGLLTLDQALVRLRREPLNVPGSQTHFLPAGKLAVPTVAEDAEAVKALQTAPAGPASPTGDEATPRLPGSPGAPRIAALVDQAKRRSPPAVARLQDPLALPSSTGGAQAVGRETEAARAADEASRVQQRRDDLRVAKADSADLETKAKRRSDPAFEGNMVSFDLPPTITTGLFKSVSIPTNPPDSAHISLTLTDGAPMNEVTVEVVRQWAKETAPIAMSIGPDLGMFPKGKDGVPVFLVVRSPELILARTRLRDRLVEAGLNVTEHDPYIPHVTVRYLPSEPAKAPVLRRPMVVAHTARQVALHAKGEGRAVFTLEG